MRARIISVELAQRTLYEARLAGLAAQLDHRDLVIKELLSQLRRASDIASAAATRDLRHDDLATRLASVTVEVAMPNAAAQLAAFLVPIQLAPAGLLSPWPSLCSPSACSASWIPHRCCTPPAWRRSLRGEIQRLQFYIRDRVDAQPEFQLSTGCARELLHNSANVFAKVHAPKPLVPTVPWSDLTSATPASIPAASPAP